MNSVLFTIGNFEIRWYSVLILLGVILGYVVAEKEAKRLKFNTDFLFNMFFYALIFGIIGARLYYVIFNWNVYASDPISALYIWEGGLAIHGGLIAGLITMCLYCKKYDVSLARVLDFVCPSLLLAQAIGRWGNFFNGEAHGPATTFLALQKKYIPEFIINGMNINGVYYEPTFLYESEWCILGFIIMLIIRKSKKTKIGTLSATYLMWYGIGRFFIEGKRTDSLMLGSFKVAQIVSALMFIIGLFWLMINSRKDKNESLYNKKEEKDIRFWVILDV